MKNMQERIDSQEAIKLYRASSYCYKIESTIKIIMIITALFLSLASIFFRFLPELTLFFNLIKKTTTIVNENGEDIIVNTKAYTDIVKNSKTIGEALSIISGIWLIIQMILSYRATVKKKEGNSLEERYDNFVLGLDPNPNIIRPVSDGMIRHFATRVPDDGICKKEIVTSSSPKATILNYQKSCFEYTYTLMIYAKNRFFNYIWWSYFLIIISFALLTTTMNAITSIFFPSLSAISLIVSAMIGHNEQFRYNSNALDCIKKVEEAIEEDKSTIQMQTLRNIQDSLFLSRLNSFTVPKFVERSFNKYNQKRMRKQRKFLEQEYKNNATVKSQKIEKLNEQELNLKNANRINKKKSAPSKTSKVIINKESKLPTKTIIDNKVITPEKVKEKEKEINKAPAIKKPKDGNTKKG